MRKAAALRAPSMAQGDGTRAWRTTNMASGQKHLSRTAARRDWRLMLLSAFVLLCVAFGGSSRADNISMLVVRPLAVLFATAALLLPGPRHWAGLRAPLLLLAALAATMAIQLVPLPPAVWTALPGHARFVEAAAAAGLPQPWRPISAAPDMTINSLLALVVPAAVLIGAATVAPRERARLLPVLLIAAIVSAVIGVAQWAGATGGSLHLYRQSDEFQPLGFFANRNHQAVFLAMALPLLRVWAVLPSDLVSRPGTRSWLAGAVVILLVPVILATGSRSGFVLALAGGLAALFIVPVDWRALTRAGRVSRRSMLIAAVIGALVVALAASVLFLGRAVSVERLHRINDVEMDLRVQYLPIVLGITRDYLPFGSGFGTFDPMFRAYEPFWALKRTFFNHAHNDLVELVLTGGIPALLVLVAYLGFVATRARAALAHDRRRNVPAVALGGIVIIAIAMAASLTDYPLRTPAMAAVIAVATLWASMPFRERVITTV